MPLTFAPMQITYALERKNPSTPEPPYHDAGERRGEEELRAQLQDITERHAAPVQPGEALRDAPRELSNLQRDAWASGFVVTYSMGGKDPQPVPILS